MCKYTYSKEIIIKFEEILTQKTTCMAVIGIDVGGTKIAAAAFGDSGELYAKKTKLLKGREGDQVGELIAKIINDIYAKIPDQKIDGIGICVPGIYYTKTDTVWAPNIPGWDNYPLVSCLNGRLDEKLKGVDIVVGSDRSCYILGELWKGAAVGCDDAIYIAVGTGIGAGILVDGRIIHGANDIAGATGWMALQYPYQEEYIPVGCFEYYASGNGIATQMHRALRCVRNYNGCLKGKEIADVTSHDVFEAYSKGDHLAAKVLDKAVEMWGMATANMVSLFNPQKVIFGGGVFGPARMFIRRIYDEACKWGQPISMEQVEFCPSKLQGGDAALLGAAYLVIRNKNRL